MTFFFGSMAVILGETALIGGIGHILKSENLLLFRRRKCDFSFVFGGDSVDLDLEIIEWQKSGFERTFLT